MIRLLLGLASIAGLVAILRRRKQQQRNVVVFVDFKTGERRIAQTLTRVRR